MSEIEWKPIPGWEGHYEVSSDGQVRSLDRADSLGRPLRGRILRPTMPKHGYPMFGLSRGKTRKLVTAHKVVMLAFAGIPPEGHVVRHIDGDPSNNSRENLMYGTVSQNMYDAVRHGTHACAAKTHCPQDHEYTPENTYVFRGRRQCRKCAAVHKAGYAARKRLAA